MLKNNLEYHVQNLIPIISKYDLFSIKTYQIIYRKVVIYDAILCVQKKIYKSNHLKILALNQRDRISHIITNQLE